jgi:tartrate-resistant acid phosphatase type 5
MKRKISFILITAALFFSKANAQVLIKDSNNYVAPATLTVVPGALNFIAMGDWGRNGADHQKEVALQMGKTAYDIKSQFTIAAGDNFYPSGVISQWDPLFKYSFEDIYTAFSLQWDWYPVLGNHDYKSNPDAEVAYSKISRRWKMPARYYSKLIAIPGDTASKVLFLFIDTNTLIPEFYSNADYGPNVRSQDSAKQKKWIAKELSNTSANIKWKIVVGHHPMFTGGSRTETYDTKAIRNSLQPLFDKYAVDVFIAGHEHSLQHLVAGKTQHFISGAASERTAVRLIPQSKMAASAYGFMFFSVTKNALTVNTIDETGKIIYNSTINK